MSLILEKQLSQDEIDRQFYEIVGGGGVLVDLPEFQETTASKNIAMLIEYGFTDWSVQYLKKQIFTGINENTDGKSEPYALERNESGQVTVDNMGRLAVDLSQAYLDEVAGPAAASKGDQAAALWEHGYSHLLAAEAADRLAGSDDKDGVLVITAAPNEEEIEALNSGEVDGGGVRYCYKPKMNVAIYMQQNEALPMFIYDEDAHDLMRSANDLAQRRGGEIIYQSEQGVSGQSVVIEFGEQQKFDLDLVHDFTKYMKTNLESDVNIRGSDEAMAYIDDLSDTTVRLAKESHITQRASSQTRQMARELLEASREDGSSYVPAEHVEWVERLIANPNMKFTPEMAALFAYMQEYTAWINIRYLLGKDDEFNRTLQSRMHASGVEIGGHGVAAIIANEVAMPDCPGSIQSSLMNNGRESQNASAVAAINRKQKQILNNSFAIRRSRKGVCRASGKNGCSSHVGNRVKRNYQNSMEKVGELTQRKQAGEKVLFSGLKMAFYKMQESAALRKMNKDTIVDVYECGFCMSCEKSNKITGVNLGRWVTS